MASGATQTPVVAISNPQAGAGKPQETCGSRRHRCIENVRLEVSIRRAPPTASRLNLSCVRTGALVSAVKDGGFYGDHHWG
jgi:hypothetical protein